MLDGLFVAPAVTAIREALVSARASDGPIAVAGNAKLVTALAAHRKVIPIGLSERAAKKLAPRSTLGELVDDPGKLEERSLDAIVGVDIAVDEAWAETLRTWARVVRDGGAIVFVDRNHATEASRRALCAGLTELEQRHAGRTVITSGLVTHL